MTGHTPGVAGGAEELAAVIALMTEHTPKTQPPMGLVVGCGCGWRIGRTMYEGYEEHVAKAILASDWLALRDRADALASDRDERGERG